jgi:FtsP/CotA-like multicopper oxidase with cupredoxin domain
MKRIDEAHMNPADKEVFPSATEGLSDAQRPATVELTDGAVFELGIGAVKKQIDDVAVRMLAYNGSIPGPTLRVAQGSEITVTTTNLGDIESTVHWHGLRLDNRYDGVPSETQAPIEIGQSYTAKLRFPDAGFYWYHPHIREDFAQEMGLYGTIIVEPTDPSYWPAADRDLTITLDDVLIEDGNMAPFLRSGPTFTAMGRFGNVMLINGETHFSHAAAVGEVVRIYLVNTANTRIFNFALPGARMKLVGGDSGRYEREKFVDAVLLAPSERAVVDVLFETPGEVPVEHRTPDRVYDLGVVSVAEAEAEGEVGSFDELRNNPDFAEERERMGSELERPPDKTLAFVSSMPLLYGEQDVQASTYQCPMHPEITASFPGTCPKCGMGLIPAAARTPPPEAYVCPTHSEITASWSGTCPRCGATLIASGAPPLTASVPQHDLEHVHGTDDGLEWEDLMPEINRGTDPSNMIWQLIDRDTGDVNGAISWAFKVGDRVKIRLVNEMEGSDHPMHHPFHIHGAGRFLVLARDGAPEDNLVWKDTVLCYAGETVDILLDVTNPGLWMVHCHIAEHMQSGMMFSFEVTP